MCQARIDTRIFVLSCNTLPNESSWTNLAITIDSGNLFDNDIWYFICKSSIEQMKGNRTPRNAEYLVILHVFNIFELINK